MAGIFDLNHDDWVKLLFIVDQYYKQQPSSQTDADHESQRDRVLAALMAMAFPNG